MSPSSRLVLLRTVLAVLAFSALSVGVLASFSPRSFYDDFPLGADWVSLLPPYNEHLVTDVAGFQLAFGLLFAWAAVRPARALVVPLCGAWIVSQVLHFLFHVTHLGNFSTGDAIAQTVGLGLVVVLPVAAIVLVGGARRTSPAGASRPGGRSRW